MAKAKEKKQKSMTYYVLKSPGKEDLKFKKLYNAQLHSFIHHNDFPTYSIYKINIVTKEELVESGENDVMNDKEETTVLNNKNIFKFFNKKEDPKYQKEVNQIRIGLEKLGTVSCTDAELGQAWRDFSDECYCASFLIPDDESIRHFAEWLDFDNVDDDEVEE